ncbi:MAG: hypothetical protein KF712_08890 [Akkermansiaceae bacterium]|nr:hypothetical protein [Akkermansiaceae bacterium]
MLFNDSSAKETSPLTTRRGALGTISLASIGLAATSTQASAFLFQKKDTPPVVEVRSGSSVPARRTGNAIEAASFNGIPGEWAGIQGSLLPEYTRYLASLKLQRLEPQQVIAAHAKQKGAVWNRLPPKQWWTRMGYTLRVVDRIAVYLNMPVDEIVSAYRCPVYNAQCEGAKVGSWHQANVAVDVKFPAKASSITAATRNLRDRGLFKGGVGGYGSFTHIDTRGVNVNW